MLKKSERGFTLIELLVVIAIIGILSSVVLASLNSARGKGADATIKSNLANMRAQAELYYDSSSNSYVNLCADTKITGMIDSAKSAAGVSSATRDNTVAGAAGFATCHAVATGWATEVPMKSVSTNFACVDGNGVATTTGGSTLTTAADTTCG